MLPDIHRATQKFYIFLIVYLTGCTPDFDDFVFYTTESKSIPFHVGLFLEDDFS